MFITCVEVHVHRSICLKIIYNFLLNFAARLYIVQNHITKTMSSSSNTKGGNVVLANTNVNFVCFAPRYTQYATICFFQSAQYILQVLREKPCVDGSFHYFAGRYDCHKLFPNPFFSLLPRWARSLHEHAPTD